MILPRFSELMRTYPISSSASVRQAIGDEALESWLGENTCVLRMSRAFNYAGKVYEIPKAGSVSVPGTKYGRMETVRGADGKHYAYRVSEFEQFLRTNYGAPSVTCAGTSISITQFKGLTGIIVWYVAGWEDATGHFTVWNGSSGLYEGNNNYFRDFKTTPSVPGQQKVPYLTDVKLWEC